jgi:zinc transport system ATP-binding protein
MQNGEALSSIVRKKNAQCNDQSTGEAVSGTPYAIEVDHVSFSYEGQRARDGVSFAVPEGAYVGLIGPNGGGKTTLLRLLLGLEHPESGSVSLFGVSPQDACKQGIIGYIPQSTMVHSSFPASIEEVVRSGRTMKRSVFSFASEKENDVIDNALKIVGIHHLKDRTIGSVSGGERQKAFIARAIAGESKILLLDEPMTGVDPVSRDHFYALLKHLNADHGMTILFVTHDIDVAKNEVSFVLALNQKLLCHCASHDFVAEETLKKLYGREMELNHPHCH